MTHQLSEIRSVQIVASDLVVELGVPVQLYRSWNVAGVIEQDVLVGLHDSDSV